MPAPRKAPPKHKPTRAKLNDGRPSAAAQGYGGRWRELRRAILYERPLCEHCGKAQSEHVDHIRPARTSGLDFYDRSNLQALCPSCHDRKTATYDGGFGRPLKGS